MAELAPILNRSAYDEDFFLWTREQARPLRERRFDELDLDHLIEEMESAGASERRDIRNRLAILLCHLLKWRLQPGARSRRWQSTIAERCEQIAELVAMSPSLRDVPAERYAAAYRSGRLQAARETGMDLSLFPEDPPFTLEQTLDDGFLPPEPDLHHAG